MLLFFLNFFGFVGDLSIWRGGRGCGFELAAGAVKIKNLGRAEKIFGDGSAGCRTGMTGRRCASGGDGARTLNERRCRLRSGRQGGGFWFDGLGSGFG